MAPNHRKSPKTTQPGVPVIIVIAGGLLGIPKAVLECCRIGGISDRPGSIIALVFGAAMIAAVVWPSVAPPKSGLSSKTGKSRKIDASELIQRLATIFNGRTIVILAVWTCVIAFAIWCGHQALRTAHRQQMIASHELALTDQAQIALLIDHEPDLIYAEETEVDSAFDKHATSWDVNFYPQCPPQGGAIRPGEKYTITSLSLYKRYSDIEHRQSKYLAGRSRGEVDRYQLDYVWRHSDPVIDVRGDTAFAISVTQRRPLDRIGTWQRPQPFASEIWRFSKTNGRWYVTDFYFNIPGSYKDPTSYAYRAFVDLEASNPPYWSRVSNHVSTAGSKS